MLAVAYSSRFVHDVFFNGEPIDLPRQPHEPPRWMRAPIELLVLLCLLVGVFPGWTVGPLLDAAAGATLQAPLPGIRTGAVARLQQALLMSLLALAGGVLIYALRGRSSPGRPVAADAPAHRLRALLPRTRRARAASWQVLDNGSLQRYNALLFSFIVLLGGWAFFSGPAATLRLPGQPADEAATAALLALLLGHGRHAAVPATAAGGDPGQRRRPGRGADLRSPVGTRPGADPARRRNRDDHPDAAGALLSARREAPPRSSARRLIRDLLLALLRRWRHGADHPAMLAAPFETISGFYLQQAVPGGGGANVVNVILVDFRGFDTLGEITVLAMVALASHALLDRLILTAPASHDSDGRRWASEAHPLFLSMLMRPLLPLR
jgi:multicomponent K+:H+ antiporter subunit A